MTTQIVQPSFEEVGEPLSEVTFVVVDIETSGTRADAGGITEIGAVKVRGGEVLGEFQTLISINQPLPAYISTLTGITDGMLADAPGISAVMPAFLEFIVGSVLVAHNAPFDISFLKAAAAKLDLPWPPLQVVDTVKLARRVVDRSEAPNCKLGTLAALFGARTTPDHRALADARATVDVLHALLERLAPLGITHREDLAHAADDVPARRRQKRHLADGLPNTPGVYIFRDSHRNPLYIGTASHLRRRVRSYFTTAERRTRMNEMVALAESVDTVPCETVLEAQVRELRLIAEYRPHYNRRSRFPTRVPWVRVAPAEESAWHVVTTVRPDQACYLGPYSNRREASETISLLRELYGSGSGAADRGLAPHWNAEEVWSVCTADPRPLIDHEAARIARMSDRGEFEQAGRLRDRLLSYLAAQARAQRLTAFAGCAQIVFAQPAENSTWELAIVSYGRLVATSRTSPGADPRPALAVLQATAELAQKPVLPNPACSVAETELILHWAGRDGVRLVDCEGSWSMPMWAGGAFVDPAALATAVKRAAAVESGPGANASSPGPKLGDDFCPTTDTALAGAEQSGQPAAPADPAGRRMEATAGSAAAPAAKGVA